MKHGWKLTQILNTSIFFVEIIIFVQMNLGAPDVHLNRTCLNLNLDVRVQVRHQAAPNLSTQVQVCLK